MRRGQLIEERATACGAALVLEPAADGGAMKIGRKGTGGFEVVVHGRAAHAGLEPEKGVNALVEASHQVLAIAALADPERGTTVTPTVASAGTADNVVPAEARVRVDVRVTELAEAERLEAAMAALAPVDPAARLEVLGGLNRPPMPESATAELFELARQAACTIGRRRAGRGGRRRRQRRQLHRRPRHPDARRARRHRRRRPRRPRVGRHHHHARPSPVAGVVDAIRAEHPSAGCCGRQRRTRSMARTLGSVRNPDPARRCRRGPACRRRGTTRAWRGSPRCRGCASSAGRCGRAGRRRRRRRAPSTAARGRR